MTYRYRITFEKTAAIRFVGHLDLYRAWERLFRRANLPLAYSQGFKPHSHINLGSALPLGCTSSNDLLDVWFSEAIRPEEILNRLRAASPPGITIQTVETISLEQKTLQSMIVASDFLITINQWVPDLDSRLAVFLEQPEIIRERRGKTYNLKDLVVELVLLENRQENLQCLQAILQTKEKATGRPDELIQALNLDQEQVEIHRKGFRFDLPNESIDLFSVN